MNINFVSLYYVCMYIIVLFISLLIVYKSTYLILRYKVSHFEYIDAYIVNVHSDRYRFNKKKYISC